MTEQAKPYRWMYGQYVLDGSVVGTIHEDPCGRGYWASGCMSDWQDTNLGLHHSEAQACNAVELWVLVYIDTKPPVPAKAK